MSILGTIYQKIGGYQWRVLREENWFWKCCNSPMPGNNNKSREKSFQMNFQFVLFASTADKFPEI